MEEGSIPEQPGYPGVFGSPYPLQGPPSRCPQFDVKGASSRDLQTLTEKP